MNFIHYFRTLSQHCTIYLTVQLASYSFSPPESTPKLLSGQKVRQGNKNSTSIRIHSSVYTFITANWLVNNVNTGGGSKYPLHSAGD